MEFSISGYDFEISFAQIITWMIAITLSICVTRYFFRKTARNNWIGDINDEIDKLEDDAILFWMSPNDNYDTVNLSKLVRQVKKVTKLSGDIYKYGGCEYPKNIFIRLRRAVTHEEYVGNILKKDETCNSYRNVEIKSCCEELREIYKR